MNIGPTAYILGSIQVFVESFWGRCAALNDLVRSYFGTPGLWALWILVATIVLLLAGKATKITFNALRYVLVPSAALSITLVMLAPQWSPMKSFPIFVSITTVLMLFRSN